MIPHGHPARGVFDSRSNALNTTRLKPIPRFIEEDAPMQRRKVFKLIQSGELKAVRLGGRQYIDMQAWQEKIDGKAAAEKAS
jgi:hypothetical protein